MRGYILSWIWIQCGAKKPIQSIENLIAPIMVPDSIVVLMDKELKKKSVEDGQPCKHEYKVFYVQKTYVQQIALFCKKLKETAARVRSP